MKLINESVKKLTYIITFLMFISPVLALNMEIINLTNGTISDPIENMSYEAIGSYEQTYDDLVPPLLDPDRYILLYVVIAAYVILLLFLIKLLFFTKEKDKGAGDGKRKEKRFD